MGQEPHETSEDARLRRVEEKATYDLKGALWALDHLEGAHEGLLRATREQMRATIADEMLALAVKHAQGVLNEVRAENRQREVKAAAEHATGMRTKEEIQERIAVLDKPGPGRGSDPAINGAIKTLKWVLSTDQDPSFEELGAEHDSSTWMRVVRAEQKRRARS
jgi:hypothetical protein